MKRFFYYLLTIWILLWGQVLANHFIGGSWFSVDFALIGTLYFGLSRGPLGSQVLGALLGLFIDAASLGIVGMHALIYSAAGYAAGMMRRPLDETKPWAQAIFTFAMSVVYVVLYVLLDRLFSPELRPLSVRIAVRPLANAVVAPLVFWLLSNWSLAWDYRPEEV